MQFAILQLRTFTNLFEIKWDMKYERLNKRGVLISYLNNKRDKLSRFNSSNHFFVVLLHFRYHKALGIQKRKRTKKWLANATWV